MPEKMDAVDMKILQLLGEDGRMSVKEISERLNVTAPTVYSRIKRLTDSKILRVAGLVDALKVEGMIKAIIAITVEDDSKMEATLEQLTRLNNVLWAIVVTGRYDILIEVTITPGMPALYKFLTEELPKIKWIRSSESFAIMKEKNRWTHLFPDKNPFA